MAFSIVRALAGTLGAVALATPAAAGNPQALHFTAKTTQSRLVDQAPAHASLGDEQIASGTLLNGESKPVGRFGFTCTWVGIDAGQVLEHCSGEGSLPGGQLTFAGMSQPGTVEHTLAVTGGTGVYQTARGQIQLHDRNNNQTLVTVTLFDPRP
ncbi:MAG: allene oxide cyclase barrel-like domain-containing protein [Gaiellaceae bacterium]